MPAYPIEGDMKTLQIGIIVLALIVSICFIGIKFNSIEQSPNIELNTINIDSKETQNTYGRVGAISLEDNPEANLQSESLSKTIDDEDYFQKLSDISFFRQVSFEEVYYQNNFIGLSIASHKNAIELSEYGLMQGDIITHVEEEVIIGLSDFEKKIVESKLYETALVTINRNNVNIDIDIAVE